MLLSLRFKPGIVRDTTNYADNGGWWDCHWVRFRSGLPEKMGGWEKKISSAFLGVCRMIINWTVLAGVQYLGFGTHLKFYVSSGGSFDDVTPIRRTVTLGANPMAATSGSTTVTVSDTNHGAVINDYVTFSGATTFAGLSIGVLNVETQVTSVIDSNSYTITVGATASSTASGGGAAVVATYQINVGLSTSVLAYGYGTGTWGHDTWGSDSTAGVTNALRLWSADTFGEDLVTCVYNGGIYYWDATAPTTRMVALSTLTDADNVPTVATQIMVSAEERHVIAFGTNPMGSSTQDPLFIRWSATESAAIWTPLATNTAGGSRLSMGTYITAAEESRSEILIWTDLAMYAMRWSGPPYTFSFTLIGTGTNLISANGACTINDIAIWMGKEQFYMYDGRITPMVCPISDYIFRRLNYNQLQKIYGFTNSSFNEVGWFYPSTTSECDSYVIYNYKENAWYYGALGRTAWLDRGPAYYPLATDSSSYLYDHEYGMDDGSTNPVSAINAYIESSSMEASEGGPGDHFMFMDRLIPDVTFRNSSAVSPAVSMTIKTRDFPGGAVSQTDASTVTQTSTVTVEQFTEQCFIRLRGRSAIFKCENTATGVTWRLGAPRLSYRLDGRR